jgi:hypothetical protein
MARAAEAVAPRNHRVRPGNPEEKPDIPGFPAHSTQFLVHSQNA